MSGPDGEKIEKVPLIMKAGQVSFHHCFTYHGSGPNTTSLPRRSMAIHLLAGPNRYTTADHKYDHYPIQMTGMQEGDPYEGEHFPVLFHNKL